MSRKSPTNLPRDSEPENRFALWAWRLIFGVVFALPFVFSYGVDSFRMPKLWLYEAGAIAAVAIAIIAALLGKPLFTFAEIRKQPAAIIAAAAVVWTLIATLASTNRVLSAHTLVWVASCAAMFVITSIVARGRSLASVPLLFLPAFVNSAIFLLQELALWTPFDIHGDYTQHSKSIALFGNPSDFGVYLLAPALAALTLAATTRSRRPLAILIAALLGLMMIVSLTLTAIIAYVAAALVLFTILYGRKVFIAAIVAGIIVLGAAMFYAPLRFRAQMITYQLKNGYYDGVLSGRLTPFYAAIDMAADHPLTGIGPGCYGFHYFPYKLRVENEHPKQIYSPVYNLNAADAHNDHLQTLAVAGIPAYLIFLAAIALLGRQTFHGASDDGDERDRFARNFALPFAAAFFVVALGQFPLELAASAGTFIHFAALCFAWRRA